jgi:hypothetical protein
MTDLLMYGALVGQALGVIGGLVVVILMFRRRAKERRERADRRAHGQSA